MCIGSESIQTATVVRDLGAHLDAELTMNRHVSKIAAASFFHLRRLRQTVAASAQRSLCGSYLHLPLITSRLDYCNSLPTGVPQSTLGVQNAAAWLIFELGPCDHVTDSLIQFTGCRSAGEYNINWTCWCRRNVSRVPENYCRTSYAITSRGAPRRSSSYRVYAPSSVNVPPASPTRLRGTHCLPTSGARRTDNFQNSTEISFLP